MATRTFEKLASGIYLEGLAADTERNVVWYSDVIAGGVRGLRNLTEPLPTLNAERKWTGGIALNEGGIVLSSGRGGIMWNNPASGKSGWLIDTIDGAPINGINEMIPDGDGGLYFDTVDLDSIVDGKAPRPVAIYRLTRERDVIKLIDGLGFANGLAVSPDGRSLYCSQSFYGALAFDIAADRTLTNQRTVLEKNDVDGMAMDADGVLWITGFRSSAITRIAADGALLQPFTTPARAITQMRFGGDDMRDLFFTATTPDSGQQLKDGETPTEQTSFLYLTRSDTPGLPITPTRFKLG